MRTPTAILALLALLTCGGVAQSQQVTSKESPIGAATSQLLLVRSASWYATKGTLQRYDRNGQHGWVPFESAIAVNLGRGGMAWGRGLHTTSLGGPTKREGDGRTPAGAFALGTVFGKAEALPAGAQWKDYLQAQKTTYCVEDVRSMQYNQVIEVTATTRKPWQRHSPMLRPDGLFDWGLVVRQNEQNVVGGGSCVFLHIWRGPSIPTSGCTAMARERIESTIGWLKNDANPVLVQLPEPVFRALREGWGLP